MEVITIVNRKGGVGKTATAQALGAGLKRRGRRVLFVDLDSQKNLTYAIGSGAGYSSMDILTGRAQALEAIQHTAQGDIIAATEALAGADVILTQTGREYRLFDALEAVRGLYDNIIIDTPAQLGIVTINALTASDCAIIPAQADLYSLQAIAQLYDTVKAVKRYCNRALYIRGILITRYNGRAVLSRDMAGNMQQAAAQLGTKVYETKIRECIAVKEAQAQQQDIFTYAPRSNAAKDYDSFIEEFLTDERGQA